MFSLARTGNVSFIAAALGTTIALAADPTTRPDLEDRINSLQTEINQLKAEQSAMRAQDEQRQQTQELFKDAQSHSQLLDAQGVLAGYTNGRFILQSEDGKFLAHPWLQLQFRNVTDFREGVKHNGADDDTQNGFETRRLKFGADGNLFGNQLTYFTQFAVDRHTGNVQMEMAWAKYQFDDSPFAIRGGQFKDPLDHEQLATSRLFPAIDRSLIDDVFANAEGFVKGVSFIYDPASSVRAEFAYHGGLRNFDTNFQQYPTAGIPTNWATAARIEVKPFGKWKEYEQITAYGIKENTLVFGAGADYTETGHSDALVHVADGQYQTASGLSIYAAYLGRYATRNTSAKVDTYDPTARLQAAWAINSHWEPYARYEYIHFNGHEFAKGTELNVHVITAGVNYYLYGQSFKVSGDVSYLPNGVPVNDDGFGLLANNGRDEVVGRMQFQLLL